MQVYKQVCTLCSILKTRHLFFLLLHGIRLRRRKRVEGALEVLARLGVVVIVEGGDGPLGPLLDLVHLLPWELG